MRHLQQTLYMPNKDQYLCVLSGFNKGRKTQYAQELWSNRV